MASTPDGVSDDTTIASSVLSAVPIPRWLAHTVLIALPILAMIIVFARAASPTRRSAALRNAMNELERVWWCVCEEGLSSERFKELHAELIRSENMLFLNFSSLTVERVRNEGVELREKALNESLSLRGNLRAMVGPLWFKLHRCTREIKILTAKLEILEARQLAMEGHLTIEKRVSALFIVNTLFHKEQ
uniref:Uncharacterized protein n=1 Tax=Mycena chlorophos TaxID=658473 RepID=A0ABQ0L736_MYCCL|nr:predicted protein [Mycena chlorophos]